MAALDGPGRTRAYIPEPVDTWDQAFREACDLQDAVERGTYRSEKGMTFAQLAHDHFLPRYSSGTNLATTTSRTVDSHFGDGTGKPRRKGRKNELGARFALLYVFGRYRLNEISPAISAAGRTRCSPRATCTAPSWPSARC